MPQNQATQIGRSAPARASNGGFLHLHYASSTDCQTACENPLGELGLWTAATSRFAILFRRSRRGAGAEVANCGLLRRTTATSVKKGDDRPKATRDVVDMLLSSCRRLTSKRRAKNHLASLG